MQSALYLALPKRLPASPQHRLIAAKRRVLKIGVFRYSPYSGLQYDRPTPSISVRQVTKVVQVLPLTLGFQASFFATMNPLFFDAFGVYIRVFFYSPSLHSLVPFACLARLTPRFFIEVSAFLAEVTWVRLLLRSPIPATGRKVASVTRSFWFWVG
jgi:hypothetical protein